MNANDCGVNLEKLAVMFREEGDLETAGAIEMQLTTARSIHSAPIQWKALRRADRLESRGNKFDLRGDHDSAMPLFEKGLSIRTRTLGAGHTDTINAVYHLARCHFNGGHYPKAKELYERIHRQYAIAYGADDFLTKSAAECIVDCTNRQKDTIGSWNLQTQMNKMMNKGDAVALEKSADADRAYAIATKLLNRKQFDKAVGPFKLWLEYLLENSHGYDRGLNFSIWRYGRLLMAVGRHKEAVSTFERLVAICNRHANDESGLGDLLKALHGLGSSLDKAGMAKAAAATSALAQQLEVRQNMSALISRAKRITE